MSSKSTFLFAILIFFGLAAYCLPWIITPDRGLTLGGYDLAEWSTLHPSTHISNPPLLSSLLLRIPLLCLSIITVYRIAAKSYRSALAVGSIASIMFLPPIEFFTLYRGDPNYQQQLALAIVTITFTLFSAIHHFRKYFGLVAALAALVGTISVLWGLGQGYALIKEFGLLVQVGPGGVLTTFALLALADFQSLRSNKQTR
jgi:hypothetical protein